MRCWSVKLPVETPGCGSQQPLVREVTAAGACAGNRGLEVLEVCGIAVKSVQQQTRPELPA